MSCYIVSNLAIGKDKEPVNLDVMSTFKKFEHAATKEDKGRFQVEFRRENGSVGPCSVFWKYKSKTERDCDFDRLIENYTNTLK